MLYWCPSSGICVNLYKKYIGLFKFRTHYMDTVLIIIYMVYFWLNVDNQDYCKNDILHSPGNV